jgi:FkbM family methyltransferase
LDPGLLEKNAQIAQYLMGIGAGAGVFASGERAIFPLLRRQARPPYCVFDVGANRGQFLRLTLDSIGTEEFAVHCFEPGRGTFAMLASDAKVDSRVHLNNLGLGRERGNLQLHYDKVGSGLASLTRRNLDHFGIDFSATETVAIDPLDQYCAERAIERVHLLKIDIEGHELDALAGARRMFAARAIDLVSFEFGGCNIDTRTFFRDFWYFFAEAGMRIYRISPSGQLRAIVAYREILEQFRTTNFVAVKMGTSLAN